MIIDDQTFTDFALHLRRASDELLNAARKLTTLCDPEQPAEDDSAELIEVLEALVGMNSEFVLLEGILRAVWESNNSTVQHLC